MIIRTAPRSRPRTRALVVVVIALAAFLAGTATAAASARQHPAPVVLTAVVQPDPPTPGLLGPLTGTDSGGIPLSHYDISGNDENGWDVPATIMLFLTNAFFTMARVLVGTQVWLLNWAFSFGPAHALLGPATTIASAYQQQVIGRIGLAGTMLTLAAFCCGLMILRGRTAKGAGELAVSVLISAVAATLLASPATLLLGDNGLLGQTRDTAISLASIAASGGSSDSQSPGQAAGPLTATLISTFVVQPYQLLNFGTLMDAPDVPASCRTAYTQIVQGGPWGDAGTPRNMMAGAGCQDLANYDANLTWDRLTGAILLLVAVLFVTILIVLMTGTLLIAQFSFALYAIMCPVVTTLAVLPGARGLLWRWLGGIAKVMLVILVTVIFVPLFAVFIKALLDGTASEPLAARFFLIDLTAVAGLVFHRRLVNAGIRAGHRITGRLNAARFGGARSSPGAGVMAAAALAPVSLGELHRGARAEISKITTPARGAVHRAHKAWTGKEEPPPDGSGRLQARLATTRGGRTVLRTAKAAGMAGKIAFGSTVGAPVMIPRATKVAQAAARARSTAVKTRLTTAAARRGAAARQFGREWAANTGLAAATSAVKKGPLPAAVLSAAIHTAPAARPRKKASYSAAAPRVPATPAEAAPQSKAPVTPTTLPRLRPGKPQSLKPMSVDEMRTLLSKPRAAPHPHIPVPRTATVTAAKPLPRKRPGPGTPGSSG